MKLNRAEFYNYKILKNIILSFDETITILIGKNNSGKSAILNGLYSGLKKNSNYFNQELINKKSSSDEFVIQIYFKIEEEDLEQFIDEMYLDSTKIEYLKQNFVYILNYNKNDNIEPTSIFKLTDTSQQNKFIPVELTRLQEKILDRIKESIIFIKPDRKLLESEPFISYKKLQDHVNQDQYIRHHLYFLKVKEPLIFNRLCEEFNKIFPDIKIKTDLDHDEGLTRISIEQDGVILDINDMGSGFKYFLLIISKILLSKPKIVLMDEPDLNMHPGLVRQLVSYLRNIENVQFVISSHNETFVNEFEEENIRHIYAKNPFSTHSEPLLESTLDSLIDDLGVNMTNFGKSRIIESKMIILFEGHDRKYVKKLIEKKGLIHKINSLNIYYDRTSGNRLIDYHILDKINGAQIPVLLVRDRDEYDTAFIEKKKTESNNRIYFWNRREIENYALNYDALFNLIQKKDHNQNLIVYLHKFSTFLWKNLKQFYYNYQDNIKIKY